MGLTTAAAVITYISQFEKAAAEEYRKAARKFSDTQELFTSLARENEKYDSNVKRAYYNVVSDALETGFCFRNVQDNIVVASLAEKSSLPAVLKASLEMEERIIVFSRTGADSSKGLLSDVSRAMARVARSREQRKQRILNELQNIGR